MPNTRYGRRYPHVTTEAKEADHSMCSVLGLVVQRVEAGQEPWWTKHVMPPVAEEAEAKQAKSALYRAGAHTKKRRGGCADVPLSVQADYEEAAGGGWAVWFRVTTLEAGRAAVVAKVKRGEQLAYNVMRSDPVG